MPNIGSPPPAPATSRVLAGARALVFAAVIGGAGGACGPSTPHAGGKATSAAGAAADAGWDASRTTVSGGTDGAREQAAPVTTGTSGLAGCGAGGGVGGSGVATTATAPAANDGGAVGGASDGGAGRTGGDALSGDAKGTGGGGRVGNGGANDSTDGGPGGAITTGGSPVPKMVRDAAGADAGADPSTQDGGLALVAGGAGGGADGGGLEINSDSAAGHTAMPDGPGQTSAPGTGDLAIDELLINPTGTDTGREWIEIVNRSDHTLSLVNLHIADAVNDAAADFTSNRDPGAATGSTANPLLAPGARTVLIQSGDPTKNGGVTWGAGDVAGTFGTLVSLNNDADTISICVGSCATGLLLSRVTWDSSLGTGYDGHALVIDDAARRCPATTPFGDAGSFGTPFAANPPCP